MQLDRVFNVKDAHSSPILLFSLTTMLTHSIADTTSAEFLEAPKELDIATDRYSHAARTKHEREMHKLEKRLCRLTGQAIVDFNMIEEGDRVMVCVSGGKDSYSMLDILLKLQARAPVRFELIAVNLDQKQPGFPEHILPEYLKSRGVPFHIEEQDTYSIVKRVVKEGKTMCSLCSRLRRGALYKVASELGCNKIALGHHRDDILQTFLLNLFFGGRLKSMPPKLLSDEGNHIVIRPMAYVSETDLQAWSEEQAFPIIPCTLCGSQENLQRKQVGNLLRQWDQQFPGRINTMFSALTKAVPSHLLDPNLFDFKGLQTTGQADADGDKAFDEERFSPAPAVHASGVLGELMGNSAKRNAWSD